MIFDARMRTVELHFGCSSADDWVDISPSWIIGLDGIGPSTLNKIRLYLASSGRTLKGDGTADHWLKKLADTSPAFDTSMYKIFVPFTILIDIQEKQPFGFQKIVADRTKWTSDLRWLDANERSLIEESDVTYSVPTVVRSLGDFHGDYSIDGFEGLCHVERKSCADAQGTILGWSERRDRFLNELEFLAGIDCGAIVVQCTFDELLKTVGSRGRKSAGENRKILYRQVLAWQQDYRVPWHFCGTRRMAEITTFRILERFYRKHKHRAKAAEKQDKQALLTL